MNATKLNAMKAATQRMLENGGYGTKACFEREVTPAAVLELIAEVERHATAAPDEAERRASLPTIQPGDELLRNGVKLAMSYGRNDDQL